MLLELSSVEARELKQALDTALRGLLEEIAHADQRAFRDMLRERYERMEQLNRRLEMTLEGSQVYA
jgi:beta-galactosidase GanA